MVSGGIHRFQSEYNPADFDVVWVENVGNLVCPAEFEVGEHAKVALLSITEGEDKPLKYPIMFQEADCLLITKIDLAPYLDFDLDKLIANVRQMNPHVRIIPVSSKTEIGLDEWFTWIKNQINSIQKK